MMRAADRELVRELVRREVAAAAADLRSELETLIYSEHAELRDGLAEVDRRLTTVHEHALRELTRRAEGKRTA